jgi:hypothetical protein
MILTGNEYLFEWDIPVTEYYTDILNHFIMLLLQLSIITFLYRDLQDFNQFVIGMLISTLFINLVGRHLIHFKSDFKQ